MILHDIPDNWQHDDVNAGLALVKRFELAVDCGAHRGVITRLLAQRYCATDSWQPWNMTPGAWLP